ncbi:MAG: membrane integrity-associated transporter subunit PqiC [Desulfobacteraceae bacterium]|nr:membrane integrity-associated transporter subunit PqiC [Desulfobacteraceae bacterium]
MKHGTCLWTHGWMFSLMVLVLSGCSTTPPVKYYTLNPFFEMGAEISSPAHKPPLAIGVGPVDFPKMLDRRQIVTRKNPYQVDVSDFHRWASSFSEDFLCVLARNISSLLPTDQVTAYPWADGFSPTLRLHLTVERFDGRFGGDVVLNVAWFVINQANTKRSVIKHSRISEPIGGDTYEDLVAAQSRALGTFSRAIADEIEKIRIREQ